MAANTRIIVDTDIIIKVFRGDSKKRQVLEPIQNELGISVITAMELMNGAPNKKREFEVSKTIKAYELHALTAAIGKKAFAIIKKYHLYHPISIPDSLIAAIAIENKFSLYTNNLDDYSFIEELNLFKP